MRVVRFYDLMVDCVENGENTTRQLANEFSLVLAEDFDLCDVFPVLCQKTGEDVYSFRYEFIGE